MNAGDAFGMAVLVILAIWITVGNLRRNGSGGTLPRVNHPRRTSLLVMAGSLAMFGVVEYLVTGNARIPWRVMPVALFYVAVRKVELRDGGVFANPSFYAWEEVDWAGWSDDTLTIRSKKRFVSPRVLRLKLDGEDREAAEQIIQENVKDVRSDGGQG
jgi:hypothetical protein